MNIFKLVVDAYQLSDDDAKELFQCDDLTLAKILDGIEKPCLDGIYKLSKKYDISLDLVMNSEATNKKDQAIINSLNDMIEKNNIKKAEDYFYSELVRRGINCISRDKVSEIYDAKNDLIKISAVIVKDNYALYNYVKSTGKNVSPGGYKLNPLRQSKDNIIDSWDMAENVVFILFKNGNLKDKGFNNVILDLDLNVLSTEEANSILKKYQNGTFEFNARNILILINKGACIERFAYTETNSIGNAIDHYEKDVFATLLLKKYCEELL